MKIALRINMKMPTFVCISIFISRENFKQQQMTFLKSLRKHAYSNLLRILPPKNENFQMKNSDIFLISAQNIDCGYSLEVPR